MPAKEYFCRYLLNCGRIEETKKALEDFSRLSNDKRNYDNVDFVKDVEKTADELSVSDQVKTLIDQYLLLSKKAGKISGSS